MAKGKWYFASVQVAGKCCLQFFDMPHISPLSFLHRQTTLAIRILVLMFCGLSWYPQHGFHSFRYVCSPEFPPLLQAQYIFTILLSSLFCIILRWGLNTLWLCISVVSLLMGCLGEYHWQGIPLLVSSNFLSRLRSLELQSARLYSAVVYVP